MSEILIAGFALAFGVIAGFVSAFYVLSKYSGDIIGKALKELLDERSRGDKKDG
jgi:hypothetical protein